MTEKETQLNIAKELEKCKNSPYYFATTYLTVKTPMGVKPYQTVLTEEEFNKRFKEIQEGKFYKK
jgi:hypothetical protein